MSDGRRLELKTGEQGICDEGQLTQDPAFTYWACPDTKTKSELGPGMLTPLRALLCPSLRLLRMVHPHRICK
jgi:hypothetical protein